MTYLLLSCLELGKIVLSFVGQWMFLVIEITLSTFERFGPEVRGVRTR